MDIPKTPLKAIRAYCIGCSVTAREVTRCPVDDCPLYEYRNGRNPKRRGIGGNPDFNSEGRKA